MPDFPPVIDLSTLTALEGHIIQGDLPYDTAGWSVSSAGDVNGDGFDDLIVGAPLGDDGGIGAGEAYVVFGHAGPFGTVDLSALGTAGFVIQGDAADDRAGWSVSSAGDVNGDGFADLIVGAPYGSDVKVGAGEAYVVFGASGLEGTTVDLSNLGTTGFRIQGDAAGDRAGWSVSSAGDVNGDGFDDVIVGAPRGDDGGNSAGEAYVVFGDATGLAGVTVDLTNLGTAGFVIQGDAAGDRAGWSVSSAGDVNGDGLADLIVGAPNGDDGGINAGESYVVFGNATGLAGAVIDLTNLGTAGFVIQGDTAKDYAGLSVSSAGDVDGDGFDDLILGATGGDDGGSNAGEGYVVFGSASGLAGTTVDLTNLGTAGFIIRGDRAGDRAGWSVSSAGDVNCDGFFDIIVGASRGDDGGVNAGEAYVIFGRASGLAGTVIDLTNLGTDGFIIQGDEAGDFTGLSVSSAGDINGDGFDDMVIGAPNGDDGGVNAGEAYVIFGRAPTTAVTRIGAAADQTIRGGAFDDRLSGLGGDDRLFGAGGNDTLDGGIGADALFGGAGNDRYMVNDVGDVVTEAAGQGTDVIKSTISFTLVANVENLRLLGSGAIDAFGNGEANALTGNGASNTLSGGDGNDSLNGAGGADILQGGTGNDAYFIDVAGDTIVELANEGIDRVSATIDYTLGSNVEGLRIRGDVRFGTGNELDNAIQGSSEKNTLVGLDGNDEINGGSGFDALEGGAGDDVLNGGYGKDRLTGGTGLDQFVFVAGETSADRSEADIVMDFKHAEADRLKLNLIDANTGLAGDQRFAFIGAGAFTGVAGQLHYVQTGGNTFVEGDTDGDGLADFSIRVLGLINLVGADFVL